MLDAQSMTTEHDETKFPIDCFRFDSVYGLRGCSLSDSQILKLPTDFEKEACPRCGCEIFARNKDDGLYYCAACHK